VPGRLSGTLPEDRRTGDALRERGAIEGGGSRGAGADSTGCTADCSGLSWYGGGDGG
jgi:hypothetical protein